MNFMSGRPGFYGDITGSAGNVSSSSPSSSSFHRGGHLLNYDYAAGGAAHPPPPDSSPTNSGGAEDSDDRMVYRRGEEGGCSRAVVIEKEHMFDKVVTPSDVGKLNRLVIPKQHAEKYFPLDSSTNEKGLLLNFEDKIGKPWRFRYSYWNSSQSYVMTKGWSRFVKEKKLDAGDTVSFQRGVGELGKDRLFIDWWHRPDAPELAPRFSIPSQISFHRSSSIHPWSPLFQQPRSRFGNSHFLHANAISPTPNQSYHHHSLTGYGPYAYNNSVLHGNPCPPASAVYLRSPRPRAAAAGAFNTQQVGMGQLAAERGRGVEQMVFNSVPVVQGKAAAKRLRLFGVNMDCPISESDECDIPSTTLPHLHQLLPPPFDDIMSSPSSSIPRPNPNRSIDDDKGKGSTSLDLDI